MAIITESEGEEEESSSNYDVFLSFRGVDTRLNFTDHLNEALKKDNIRTFLDEEEIDTGEDLKPELERAIRGARASIVVLSKNYASSTWCLDELVLILEQRRISNHIVLPIFYNVAPSDVRKQQSSFGDALAKHERKLMAETDAGKKRRWAGKVELWRKALMEVADLKGKDAHGRQETVFIKEIVTDIGGRLNIHLRSKIPHIIGRLDSVETITSWVKDQSAHVAHILTIWGMGGIGKTYLANYIYKLHYGEFERSIFIKDIGRRCLHSSGLLDIQRQLLKDIRKGGLIEVHDVDVCTARIEKSLLSQQILLVLDDIDNFEQLNMLVGRKGFHPGSKIIITTKDGSLTEKCGLCRTNVPPKHTKHLLKGLDETESRCLLSWHAFGCNKPKEGYEEESTKLLKYCGGHPLALTVLGSSLLNEGIAAWEDTLELLKQEINPDIKKVLQISFDSLPFENDKELLKHIACFFVGKDREFVEIILRGCSIRTQFGLSKLIDRCLLTIGPDNELMMHQLLQEMCRDLVRRESPKKPWKRSRLWCHEESYNVLKEEKGMEKLQGLLLDMKMLEKKTPHQSFNAINHKLEDDLHKNLRYVSFLQRFHELLLRILWLFVWVFLLFSLFHHNKLDLKTNVFNKAGNIKLLQLNYVKLEGSYENFPKGLRWLCMHGFRSKYIPLDLPTENLIALDMSYSNLERLWKKPKVLGSLKFLNLSSSKLVRVGNFSSLPALERLILARCKSLIEVCESIGQCKKLLLLDLSYCNKLKKFPRSIGKLQNFKILLIDGCVDLVKFFIETNDVDQLNVNPSVGVVEAISRIPKCFTSSLPRSLVRLSLEKNNLSNESFPMDFSGLSTLEELYLGFNPIKSLPDCVRSLKSLKLLDLGGCHVLQSVLCPPSMITSLEAIYGDSQEKMSFHPKIMSTSPSIEFGVSNSLTEIQDKFKMQPIVNEQIVSMLGWTNLEIYKNRQEVNLNVYNTPLGPIKPQMLYEFGIISMFFKGKEVPKQVIAKRKGSSISFIMPSTHYKKLGGLNVWFAYEAPESIFSFNEIKIINETKNRTWRNFSCMNVNEAKCDEEGIVWLSHWMFKKNDLDDGDVVIVTLTMSHSSFGEKVWECGVVLLYVDDNYNKKDIDYPLDYYKSWKLHIGQSKAPLIFYD